MVKKMKQIFKEVRSERLSERDKRILLRETKEKMERIDEKTKKGIKERKMKLSKSRKKALKGLFKGSSKGGRKAIQRRAKGTRGFLGALGVIPGQASGAGAGRPKGTYKYGMPIHLYKKMLRDKKSQYQRYQQERTMKLSTKGFTSEQIQQLQQQQAIAEMQQPQFRGRDEDEQYTEMPQAQPQRPQVQRKQGYGRIIPISQQIRPGRSVADDELDFRQWSAEKTISPRSQRIFDSIRRVQNKAKTDNIEQQRRHRERDMAGKIMNVLKSHENMINVDMDFTGVNPDENILMARSVFKENKENNILRKRRNLLDTRSYGNQLKFF